MWVRRESMGGVIEGEGREGGCGEISVAFRRGSSGENTPFRRDPARRPAFVFTPLRFLFTHRLSERAPCEAWRRFKKVVEGRKRKTVGGDLRARRDDGVLVGWRAAVEGRYEGRIKVLGFECAALALHWRSLPALRCRERSKQLGYKSGRTWAVERQALDLRFHEHLPFVENFVYGKARWKGDGYRILLQTYVEQLRIGLLRSREFPCVAIVCSTSPQGGCFRCGVGFCLFKSSYVSCLTASARGARHVVPDFLDVVVSSIPSARRMTCSERFDIKHQGVVDTRDEERCDSPLGFAGSWDV
ncbi:hypothetical protein FA13DRAFT_1714730 [Coprinellus micaceus]|uniref:Uncharacterized protein n=1 Tax=Coprinellus micaceus TaxID=71717 RepID=A0A4Y7RIS7_COPMI|nr:hypothetical protein FA13DRAFT_1722727 [Coprinellus micaceus]TEB24445.1 hypothetical protein FA13DRAFT_1714730 [Coprinellus micaceus]